MSKPGAEPAEGWSVRTQLVTIVAVVALLLTVAGVWLAHVRLVEAQEESVRDATFQARLGSEAVEDALLQAQSTASGLAAGLPVAALIADPSQCSLAFTELGVFTTGHIDIVLPGGRVPCSSVTERGAPQGATHADAGWVGDADTATGPAVTEVFADSLTGQQAIAVTAPATGASGELDAIVAVVLPLTGLGEGLERTYGGPQGLAFSVRASDGGILAAPSESAAGGDVIIGRDTVPDLGWLLSAQVSSDEALAPVRAAQWRRSAVEGVAIVLLLGLVTVLNRRIGRPLRALTTAAAEASRQVTPAQVAESGPAEVRRLARAFNTMIAARSHYEEQMTHHTLHDPLTGLPNRALLLDRMRQALSAADEDPARLVLLSIDLDRFKLVNVSLGYGHGDEVLRAAATRLSRIPGHGDTFARSGGDGFVLCLSDTAGDRGGQSAARRVTDCLAEPFSVNGTTVTLSASIGIAVGRRGATAEDLLRDADTAMYAAKDAGGGRYTVIDDELRSRSSERLTLETDLRDALSAGQLRVEYQPVVNLLTGQVSGAEALVRWHHPTRGHVSPLTFIPVAEAAGIIGPIGHFVLDEACRQAVSWGADGHRLRMAVNVSGVQLLDPGFVDQVAAALNGHGLNPKQLCLELTETILMHDTMRVSEVLGELKGLGVDLSVDDFGTGYSSLAYLKRFPVDELKIDRCFVQDLDAAELDQSLVAAIVAMGHALGLHVVAEGVETHAQMATLLTLGCRTAQGYLFSRPLPPAQVSALLETGLPADLRRPVTAGLAHAARNNRGAAAADARRRGK